MDVPTSVANKIGKLSLDQLRAATERITIMQKKRKSKWDKALLETSGILPKPFVRELSGLYPYQLWDVLTLIDKRSKELRVLTANFGFGDRVSFEFKYRTIVGTVVKVNKKTFGVKTDSGAYWTVSEKYLIKESIP